MTTDNKTLRKAICELTLEEIDKEIENAHKIGCDDYCVTLLDERQARSRLMADPGAWAETEPTPPSERSSVHFRSPGKKEKEKIYFERPCEECKEKVEKIVLRYVLVRDLILHRDLIYHSMCYQRMYERKWKGRAVV